MDILLIILLIFAVCVFFYFIQHLQSAWYYWLTFGFLPMGLHMRKGTNIHTWKIPIIGPIINYTTASLVNMIDALIWLLLWLPGFKGLTRFLYRSPDMLERYLSWLLGGVNGHRNFLSHSVLNPVFLLIVWGINTMIQLSPIFWWQLFWQIIGSVMALSFIAHLLADTLPKAWLGKALIKVVFIFHFTTLSINQSKLWLHLNAILCFLWFTYHLQLWHYLT